MKGGTISGNTGGYYGGAICVHRSRKDGMEPKVHVSGSLISNWGYGIVTLIGPVIGAVAAVLLFGAIPW